MEVTLINIRINFLYLLLLTIKKGVFMETKILRTKWPKFIRHLDEQGFCRALKIAYRNEIDRILKKMDEGKFSTYAEHFSEIKEQKSRTDATLRFKEHVVAMIKRFDLYGYYPEKKVRYTKDKGRLDEMLIPSYKELVDKYRNRLEKTGLKKTTIDADVFIARKFLNHLQDAGIMTLKDTKESVVHELFLTYVNSRRGYDFSFGVRRFMTKMEYAIGKKLSSRIISYLPKSAKIHKPYDAITIEEMDKLKGVLADDSLGFSFRDRAIMTVALYTGLRRSDIANLQLDDIDWENDKIRIKQGKTGNPLTLPLRPVVGNAIYDYIVNERPKVNLPYVFLTDEPNNPRKRKMSPSVFSKMSYKFFDAAGIRMNGENRGFHMFRHHMATALLSKGYETPIIMSVLGHTAPLAVDYYLESDYNQLKECGIDVSQWNRGKEEAL